VRARLLRIEDTRRDEAAFVDSVIAGTATGDRDAAVLTAGRLGGPTHRPALRALPADSSIPAPLRANALFALGLLKDTASVAVAERMLRASDVVSPSAAWLLGEVGEPARDAIVRALGDRTLSARGRGALLLASTRLRPVPTGAIAPWVSDADSGVAWRAAYALARGRSVAGVRTLLGAAASPFAPVREQAARGLGRTMAGDTLGDLAQAALLRLARDSAPHVRINAVRSLGTYGTAGRDPILVALSDPDAGVRLAAAGSLEVVLDASLGPWADAFRADTSLVMRRTVAVSARRRGISFAELQPWRTSAEWGRRAAAVEIDAQGPASDALPRVTGWLRDADGRVRAAAAGAIATLADSVSTRSAARQTLRTSLNDADVGVRTAALQGLAAGARPDDLADALAAYEIAKRDRDNDARLAFWTLADSALAHRVGELPGDVQRRLDALARPADRLERAAASRLPRFSGWRDSTSAARPLSWYVARARESAPPTRPIARIETERGAMELVLFSSDAPLTVYNFVSLARAG
jgi:hypothetical protein